MDVEQNPDEGYFAVMLNRDRPPRSLSLMSAKDCTTDNCRIVNTSSLAEVLRVEIQQTAEIGVASVRGISLTQPELSHDLLRRLLLSWAIKSKRNFSRSQKEELVDISLGLSHVHKFILQGDSNSDNRRPAHDFEQNRAHFESTEQHQAPTGDPDIWNMVYPREIQGFTTLREEDWNIPYIPVNQEESPSVQQDNWAMVNESAGGYCLEYRQEESAHVQVGELVGIRRHQNRKSNEWGIGVVRWMKFSSSRTLRMGVEMITPKVAAIGIRAVSQADSPYQRCLMLPEIPAIHQPTTLVTSPAPWRTGQYVSINLMGKERQIQLTSVRQTTGLFTQFQFVVLNHHTQEKAHTERGRWEIDNDFTKIWSSM
jgi:hypothetical protein